LLAHYLPKLLWLRPLTSAVADLDRTTRRRSFSHANMLPVLEGRHTVSLRLPDLFYFIPERTEWMQESKFPTSEFMSFLRSISSHSVTLTEAFQGGSAQHTSQDSTPKEGSEACAAASRASSNDLGTEWGAQASEDMPEEFMGIPDNSTDLKQHQLRVDEVQRRRFEMMEGDTPARKKKEFLKWCLSELCSVLPISGKISLCHSIREYMGNTRVSSVQVCVVLSIASSFPHAVSFLIPSRTSTVHRVDFTAALFL
jgi:hypothetical protein